jgi:hypothetical protein
MAADYFQPWIAAQREASVAYKVLSGMGQVTE